ncbi:MAG: hypothetical protein E6X43_05150, partial [Peptostreptococcaceae bacterium]|nr:hypothetical protein [Peptostreptococcaceae bacterium]
NSLFKFDIISHDTFIDYFLKLYTINSKLLYYISEMQIADMRRRSVGLELIKPSGEIIGKLFEKYYFSDEEMINL